MNFEKHIEDVNRNFYLTTNTPIQAYTYDGYLINKTGFDQGKVMIFDYHKIYNRVKDKLVNPSSPITLKSSDNVYFAACSICPRSLQRGFFVIGPYSNKKDNELGLPYKPDDIYEHLVSFIRILYKDCQYNKSLNQNDMAYSFHIKKAIDFIDARYADDINLDEISEYLDINKSYFCTLFKEETGKTFTEYLNKVRIHKSKKLLAESNMSILDVALSVGFNNQNYFNIVFKKVTNQTPLAFRKSALELDKRFMCTGSC